MADAVIAALITGVCTVLGVVFTNISANNKMQARMDKAMAITDTKLDALTREVREHNNFARRVPVLEEKIDVANHRISDLERKVS